MGRAEKVWFGMKVTPEQKRKIKRLAEREGTSAKEAVLRLVEQALAEESISAPSGSFLSGIEGILSVRWKVLSIWRQTLSTWKASVDRSGHANHPGYRAAGCAA